MYLAHTNACRYTLWHGILMHTYFANSPRAAFSIAPLPRLQWLAKKLTRLNDAVFVRMSECAHVRAYCMFVHVCVLVCVRERDRQDWYKVHNVVECTKNGCWFTPDCLEIRSSLVYQERTSSHDLPHHYAYVRFCPQTCTCLKSELIFTPPRFHFPFVFSFSDHGQNPILFSRLLVLSFYFHLGGSRPKSELIFTCPRVQRINFHVCGSEVWKLIRVLTPIWVSEY